MENSTDSINTTLNRDSSFYFASVTSGIILLIVFMCSIVLNTVVLWVLWKKKMLQSSVYRMIRFILINEVLIRMFGSPLIITSMLSGRWLYLDFGCYYYAFMMTWLGVTTSSLFTCVAIERYIIVCRPNKSHYLTGYTSNIIGLACYIHGLIWAFTPLMIVNGYKYEPSRLSCTPDWSNDNMEFILGLVSVCFLMPLIISMCCYITIYKSIRCHTMRTRFSSSVDIDVAYTTAITLGTFLIPWTPYMCIALHRTFGMEGQINISKEITLIPLVAAKTAGLWHPLVFGFNNRDIRIFIRSKLGQVGQTFCIIRLNRPLSSGRSESFALYERSPRKSNGQENEVTHKTNAYRPVDNNSMNVDERPAMFASPSVTEV